MVAVSFSTSLAGRPFAKKLKTSRTLAHVKFAGRTCAQAFSPATQLELPKETNALISPYTMGPFQLAHRVVLAPLTRCRAIGDYLASSLMQQQCHARSAGSAGYVHANPIDIDSKGQSQMGIVIMGRCMPTCTAQAQ